MHGLCAQQLPCFQVPHLRQQQELDETGGLACASPPSELAVCMRS
jgi:hypothetical protein